MLLFRVSGRIKKSLRLCTRYFSVICYQQINFLLTGNLKINYCIQCEHKRLELRSCLNGKLLHKDAKMCWLTYLRVYLLPKITSLVYTVELFLKIWIFLQILNSFGDCGVIIVAKNVFFVGYFAP